MSLRYLNVSKQKPNETVLGNAVIHTVDLIRSDTQQQQAVLMTERSFKNER